jgi:putative ABC transport system permease protein
MFRFLAKGLLRDRSRSFFPVLIITAGVMLTIVLHSWMNGFSVMTIRDNARFQTGHVKIVTKAYEKAIDQRPIDLGILNITEMTENMIAEFPKMAWLPRIYFGGLLDLPDEAGETNTQGEIFCVAVDLSADSKEIEILNLQNALK